MGFVKWPEDQFVRHLEGKGYGLRRLLNLQDHEPMDPHLLIERHDNMHALDLLSLSGSHADELSILRRASRDWSAMAFRMKGGPWLITWNPWHAQTRIRISLMEEVSHIVLDHKPTKMMPDPLTGLPRRTYTKSKEKQAYGVAAAALVPYNGIVRMLRQGNTIEDIAKNYQVSVDLVRMRCNVTKA